MGWAKNTHHKTQMMETNTTQTHPQITKSINKTINGNHPLQEHK